MIWSEFIMWHDGVGVNVRASDTQSQTSEARLTAIHCHVMTLGKLFTHMHTHLSLPC